MRLLISKTLLVLALIAAIWCPPSGAAPVPQAGDLTVRQLEKELGAALADDQCVQLLVKLARRWSAGVPDHEAVSSLLRRFGADLTFELAASAARQLADRAEVEPALALAAKILDRLPYHPAADRLRVLRIELQSRRSAAELHRELRRIEEHLAYSAANSPLRRVAAKALLALALKKDRPDRAALELVASSYPETTAGQRAREQLAALRLGSGDLPGAAAELETLSALQPEPRRAETLARVIAILDRSLAGGQASRRSSARYLELARRFVADYPDSVEAVRVRFALAQRELEAGQPREAARTASRLLDCPLRPAERRRAVDLLLQAESAAEHHLRVVELAGIERKRCGGRASAHCLRLDRALATAAAALSAETARQGRWQEAYLWALKAPLVSPEQRRRVAALAIRAGRLEEVERHYRRLAADFPSERGRAALRDLAEIQEARGHLAEAARTYQRLFAAARSGAERARWLGAAAKARLYSGDLETAVRTAHWLGRVVRDQAMAPATAQAHLLAIGELLAAAEGPAFRHYMGLAARFRRSNPELAARCLVRAAGLEPSRLAALKLLAQAASLANSPSSVAAVEVELARARILRRWLTRLERLGHPAPRSALDRLRRITRPLEKIALLENRPWQTEAASQLAWAYQRLERWLVTADPTSGARLLAAELRSLRQELVRRTGPLVSLAPGEKGPPLTADRLPSRSRVAGPARDLLEQGQHRAAAHVASRALAVYGPSPELLCALGAAQIELGEPQAAAAQLKRALSLDASCQCALRNMQVLEQGAAEPPARNDLFL